MEQQWRELNLGVHSSKQGILTLVYMHNGICPALFLAYYPDCNVSTPILIILTDTQTNALKDGLRLRPIKNVSMSVSSGQRNQLLLFLTQSLSQSKIRSIRLHHRL